MFTVAMTTGLCSVEVLSLDTQDAQSRGRAMLSPLPGEPSSDTGPAGWPRPAGLYPTALQADAMPHRDGLSRPPGEVRIAGRGCSRAGARACRPGPRLPRARLMSAAWRGAPGVGCGGPSAVATASGSGTATTPPGSRRRCWRRFPGSDHPCAAAVQAVGPRLSFCHWCHYWCQPGTPGRLPSAPSDHGAGRLIGGDPRARSTPRGRMVRREAGRRDCRRGPDHHGLGSGAFVAVFQTADTAEPGTASMPTKGVTEGLGSSPVAIWPAAFGCPERLAGRHQETGRLPRSHLDRPRTTTAEGGPGAPDPASRLAAPSEAIPRRPRPTGWRRRRPSAGAGSAVVSSEGVEVDGGAMGRREKTGLHVWFQCGSAPQIFQKKRSHACRSWPPGIAFVFPPLSAARVQAPGNARSTCPSWTGQPLASVASGRAWCRESTGVAARRRSGLAAGGRGRWQIRRTTGTPTGRSGACPGFDVAVCIERSGAGGEDRVPSDACALRRGLPAIVPSPLQCIIAAGHGGLGSSRSP